VEGISIPGVFNNNTISFEMFLNDSLGFWFLKNNESNFEKKDVFICCESPSWELVTSIKLRDSSRKVL